MFSDLNSECVLRTDTSTQKCRLNLTATRDERIRNKRNTKEFFSNKFMDVYFWLFIYIGWLFLQPFQPLGI